MVYSTLLMIFVMFLGCSNENKEDENFNSTALMSPEVVDEKQSEQTISRSEKVNASTSDDVDFDDMEIEEVLEYADHQLNKSNWIAARPALEFLLDDDTEPLEYHYKMGKVLFELSDYARAIDHLNYFVESADESVEKFKVSAKNYIVKCQAKAVELASKIQAIKDPTDERADLVFQIFKLYPEINFEKEVEPPPGVNKIRRKIYYLVTAMQTFAKHLEEEKTFWSYYKWGYLNYLQKWYSDAKKAKEKAILFADSHSLIFYALRLEAKIEKVAPKEASSELDKIGALDLNEDVLDSFLEKYQKDLSERQIQKAREVIKMGMKLKEKLERANSDQDKLSVLRKFKDLSQEMLSGEEFPPDIRGKIKKGTATAEKRLLELEEQIRVKQDALDG